MSSQENRPHCRRLRRFYVANPLSEAGDSFWLDASETHHLRHTIRLVPGDRCLVTDGIGWEAEASVRKFTNDKKTLLDILKITKRTKPKANKVLLRAMPALLQKGKNDYLMEKAQELGVDELWPVTTDRCEVKIPAEKVSRTVARWRKIAVEASKQSGCLAMVRISAPRSFKDVIQALTDADALVLFHPGADSMPFEKWIEEFRPLLGGIMSLNVLIGPEGGFTEEEIEWVKETGRKKNTWFVGLGETVFKADTAFVGILAALRFSNIL